MRHLGSAPRRFLRRAMFEPDLSPVAESGLPPRVLTFLLALLAAGTRVRYLEQTRRFRDWRQAHAPTWGSMATEQQDVCLSEYVLDSWDENLGVQSCRDTIAALQLFWPSRKFRLATRVVNGWQLQVPPNRAPPIDREGAMALVTIMVASGNSWAGCVAMLCFTALLRISEALALRSCDFIVTLEGLAVLQLRRTKTGDYQRVVIQDRAVVAWVVAYRKSIGVSPSDTRPLCSGSYDKFRRVLDRCSSALGLGAVSWRSHSFRRGGATVLFVAGLPVQDIAVYGRWATISSCRLYLASGEQEFNMLVRTRSTASRQRIRSVAALASRVFEVKVNQFD